MKMMNKSDYEKEQVITFSVKFLKPFNLNNFMLLKYVNTIQILNKNSEMLRNNKPEAFALCII